ncbi:hypothetical protein [Soonwooa sp.]|uniref:hypothetical protein n=1 Tax=Soonwooa sp. TaxID=1938592 RepID=UPI00261903E8|nr:hypothetical protein [Soonwooa sp.]
MKDHSKLEIEINDAKDIQFLKDKNLDEVEDLHLHIYKLISLRFIKNFKNLKSLLVGGSVKDYAPISDCISLESLYISTSGAINDLDFIKPLSIKDLRLESFRTKSKDFSIPNLESMESLEISSVSAIVNLDFLEDFTSLKRLSLFNLQSKELFDFSKLKNLEVLELTNMFHLKNFQDLKSLQQLEDLRIHQFYINRQIKIDVKKELLKVISDLENVKSISLTINDERYNKDDLKAMLK